MNVQRRNTARELVKLHYSYYWYWAVDRGEVTLKTKPIYFFHDSILFDFYKECQNTIEFLDFQETSNFNLKGDIFL